MSVLVDAIGALSLGTGTAKTQLDGAKQGSASSYILPAACRAILGIQPVFFETTPTADQTPVATLKVESDDLGLQAYEVFAEPLVNAVATNDTVISPSSPIYPAYWPTKGGEQVNFYGICQTANTVAPLMGANVYWSDSPGDLKEKPYRALVGGAAGAAGSGTSTGTSTGSVPGANISVSGSSNKLIREIDGILVNTTAAASKPLAGYMSLTAPELSYTVRAQFEPSSGLLGTGQTITHLTRVKSLKVLCRSPSTIATSLNLTTAPTTAGNFYNGILYNEV